MKIIHKYIFRELLASGAISLVALNVLMMSETVMRTSLMFAGVGASASDMALVVALIQPQAAVYTIPLALMVAVLLTYGRMNAANEIAVLRTGGMSLSSLCRPAFVLAWACLVTGLLLSCIIGPAAARKNNAHIRNIISTRAPYAIDEGIFTSAFRDVVIFVEKKTGLDALEGVFIHDNRDPARPRVVTSKSGLVESPEGRKLVLKLTDGTMNLGKGESMTDISFDRYVMSVPIEARITRHKLRTAELTPAGILKALPHMTEANQVLDSLMQFHRRFTLPIMSLCVVLFSVPLSFRAGKTGKLGGLGLGFGMIMAFYMMSAFMESMFRSLRVTAAVAGWVPLIVLAALSFYLYKKEAAR